MDTVLTLTDEPDPTAKAAAGRALYDYNIARTGVADRRPIAVTVADVAGGVILGGIWGRTELGVLFVDMLFLPQALRGHGVGSQMLTRLEQEAQRRGCREAMVETSSFQAPGFYLRHGYQEFGRIAFTVPGQARVFFRKRLEPAPEQAAV